MEWKKLLSRKLLADDSSASNTLEEGRSSFQRDFDRIVFCSAFRRLQDKTQVFPMPESDFVHTRLTHSLEVACVGRSLGNSVGASIIKRHPELKKNYTPFHFGEIVSAACLAHDIGNPPFGHSGEDAIAEYFKNGNGKKFESQIKNEKKWNDFIKFEGNAQGFRIITSLQNPNIPGGLRLTCATLGAFTKYPKESFKPSLKKEKVKQKQLRKFGFFQAEKNNFIEVANETGLLKKETSNNYLWWSRHPLAFLVEAADDVCYRIMDLEDGFRLGLLSFSDTEDLMMPFINEGELKSYKGRETNDKIGYLRAKAINNVVKEVGEAFLDEENAILNGSFDEDMLSLIGSGKQLEIIKTLSKDKIYSYKSVVEREAAGYEVLGGLLDIFINAVNEVVASDKPSFRSKNVLKLLPKQFLGSEGKPHTGLYTRLLNITDFVSGMTDSYAVSLYRKIKGISLPGR